MFAIYAGNILVGYSALEQGDAPMGVAFGRFLPADPYREIRRECQMNHADQSGLALTVKTSDGSTVPCKGVAILDYSNQAIVGKLVVVEANVLGIPYPLYGELFPGHVAAYERQFSKG